MVPPPALNRLTVRLIAPEYTGIPTQTLAPGLTTFRALEGTRIELDAQANKPLAAAELHMGEAILPRQRSSYELGPNRLQDAFTVKENTGFWFALKDTEGFRNRDAVRYDVAMFNDEAPRVMIDEPRPIATFLPTRSFPSASSSTMISACIPPG